jgi:hypothetical protein
MTTSYTEHTARNEWIQYPVNDELKKDMEEWKHGQIYETSFKFPCRNREKRWNTSVMSIRIPNLLSIWGKIHTAGEEGVMEIKYEET